MMLHIALLVVLSLGTAVLIWGRWFQRAIEYPDLRAPSPWWLHAMTTTLGVLGIAAIMFIASRSDHASEKSAFTGLLLLLEAVLSTLLLCGADTYKTDQRRSDAIVLRDEAARLKRERAKGTTNAASTAATGTSPTATQQKPSQ